MKHITFFLIALMCGLTASSATGIHNTNRQTNSYSGTQRAASYVYVIIPSVNGTWGYDIYSNAKIFIHQTSKPGLTGNEGFATKSKAKKVAELVVSKLQKGETPPSITPEELKKLKVL